MSNDTPEETPQDQSEGQVSEVSGLDPEAAETPISDGDHIAGSPSEESGEVQEGNEIGPDARMTNNYHRRGRQ